MVNDAVRLRESKTEHDKKGVAGAGSSSHNIGGTQGVGYAHNGQVGAPNKQYKPPHTPAEPEAQKFAKDISSYLLDARRQGRFQQLVISAWPQFLGSLRSFLDPHIKPLITFTVNKDYTHFNAQQLPEHIQEQREKN